MKRVAFFLFIALSASLIVAFTYRKTYRGKNTICDQSYVLCTSAQCIPNPNNEKEAICFCTVQEGKSLGHTPCTQRKPYTDQYGVQHLISTFSLEDLSSKKRMRCASGNPWADCLDKQCTVNPLDPSKAICTCTVVLSKDFVTYGGECDQTTCGKGFWSGATVDADVQNTHVIMQTLDMEYSPKKYCPSNR